MQIVVVTSEYSMLFEVNLHVKVARWATIDAMLTFASQPYTITLIDSSRNLDGQRLVLLDSSGTTAALAGVGNEATRTVALVAGLLDGEEALLQAYLA